MNGCVTTRRPARAARQERRMILPTDADTPTTRVRVGDLCVTTQAQVVVASHQHLVVHGTVWLVAGSTPFAHRFMNKRKRPRLVSMTGGT